MWRLRVLREARGRSSLDVVTDGVSRRGLSVAAPLSCYTSRLQHHPPTFSQGNTKGGSTSQNRRNPAHRALVPHEAQASVAMYPVVDQARAGSLQSANRPRCHEHTASVLRICYAVSDGSPESQKRAVWVYKVAIRRPPFPSCFFPERFLLDNQLDRGLSIPSLFLSSLSLPNTHPPHSLLTPFRFLPFVPGWTSA
jgi:hypothetical protein